MDTSSLPLPLRFRRELTESLLKYAVLESRDLPWRKDITPYKVWVSEIMLQQTRAEVVRRYYARFLDALPDVAALAKAPPDKLAKLWEGLGYYRRVALMQRAAQVLVADYGGELPADYRLLRTLPGFGEYTAGAVASFAFGLRAPALDGNLLRVLARLFAEEGNVLSNDCAARLRRLAWALLPPPAPRTAAAEKTDGEDMMAGAYAFDGHAAASWNQAMMELGAQICLPNTKPHCERCPLSPYCRACAEGSAERLPLRITNTKRRTEALTVFQMAVDNEQYVLRKRPSGGLLAGLYELPNVQGTLNENEAACAIEEMGFSVKYIGALPPARHIFTHITWQMTGYRVEIIPPKSVREPFLLATLSDIDNVYSIPGAFAAYRPKK